MMESSQETVRVHIIIKGRVQGVYFRASTVSQARRLGVTGWVKNRSDGSVEVVAEGLRSKLETLLAWCHQGPPGAVVTTVDMTWEAIKAEFNGFQIRP